MTRVGRHSAPAGSHRSGRAPRPLWLELTGFLLVTVLVAFLLKTFIVGVYFIPSGSMENTLLIGDRVVVDKLGYRLHDIHRGDVVVFDGLGSFTTQAEADAASEPGNPVRRAFRSAAGLVGL